MSDRPPSLRPVERVRGERPPGEDWRTDGFARSRHTRLLDTLVEPLEDHDPERAAEICAEICRAALVDLAPALLLLPAAERRRARVLGAFVLTLFDFAAQPGLDGDRLAEINRWEFQLEEALHGRPAGQPIFVLLAREEAARPWNRQALDQILAAARRRALAVSGPADAVGAPDPGLAAGLAGALLGEPPSDDTVRLARDLLAVAGAQRPDSTAAATDILTGPLDDLPRRWQPAARYLGLAGRRLAVTDRRSDPGGAHLGLGARLALLVRARVG